MTHKAKNKSSDCQVKAGQVRAREAGIGKLTLLVFGPILAAALYTAYIVGPFYYYFYSLQEQMRQLVRVSSIYPDKVLADKLWTHMKRMDIPAERNDIKIRRLGQQVEIAVEYREVFSIRWKGQEKILHVFDFKAFADGEGE